MPKEERPRLVVVHSNADAETARRLMALLSKHGAVCQGCPSDPHTCADQILQGSDYALIVASASSGRSAQFRIGVSLSLYRDTEVTPYFLLPIIADSRMRVLPSLLAGKPTLPTDSRSRNLRNVATAIWKEILERKKARRPVSLKTESNHQTAAAMSSVRLLERRAEHDRACQQILDDVRLTDAAEVIATAARADAIRCFTSLRSGHWYEVCSQNGNSVIAGDLDSFINQHSPLSSLRAGIPSSQLVSCKAKGRERKSSERGMALWVPVMHNHVLIGAIMALRCSESMLSFDVIDRDFLLRVAGIIGPRLRSMARRRVIRQGNSSAATGARRTGLSRLSILLLGTEWYSTKGGLSTLNRELSVALASRGHSITCFVPAATAQERSDAARKKVQLVVASNLSGNGGEEQLMRRPEVPPGWTPDIVIGHGRITGPAARVQVTDYFPGTPRIHMVHMAPGEIEWFKDETRAAEKAEARENEELSLAREAAVVVTVGPKLHREYTALLSGYRKRPPVMRFDPGFMPNWRRRILPADRCLLFGRAEDFELKGLDIAARAIANLSSAGPRPFPQPVLEVIGAPSGMEAQLRKRILKSVGAKAVNVRVYKYTSDRDRLSTKLCGCSLVLMPSRSEGFGLVGLEAIALGTPVLISSNSGLAELLVELLGSSTASQYVIQTGSATRQDALQWSQAIDRVLVDTRAAFKRARLLMDSLAGELSWDKSIESLERVFAQA